MNGPNSHKVLEVEWVSARQGAEVSKRPWRFLSIRGAGVIELGTGQFGAVGQGLLHLFWGTKDNWAENWEGGRVRTGYRADHPEPRGWLGLKAWREKEAQHGAKSCIIGTPTPWALSPARDPWESRCP